jgi:hypothetical protein
MKEIRKDILRTFKNELVRAVYERSVYDRARTKFEIDKAVHYIYTENPFATMTMYTAYLTEHNNEQQRMMRNEVVIPQLHSRINLSYPRETSRDVYSKDIPSKYICSICTDVLLNPVLSSVGNVYCEECIGEWISKEPNAVDPLTRMVITTNLIPALVVWTEMNEWKIAPSIINQNL